MEILIKLVETWSKNKNLDTADSSKQFVKVVEEVGEVASALARIDVDPEAHDRLKDGIGDVVVTLIILAQQNGMTLEQCLQVAYDEIKGRKGVTVNGLFVKEEDLPKE